MNLRQLEVFQAVMYGGTTKNAARLLRISQPAVSNMVRQFEDQLGFKLFDRIGGRLHPTLEAKVLTKNLERVFASVDAVENLVNDLRDSQVGSLKIVASPSLGQTVLPPAIAAFVRDRPEVKIGFDTPPNEAIITHLDIPRWKAACSARAACSAPCRKAIRWRASASSIRRTSKAPRLFPTRPSRRSA